ncbi:ribosome small subunit-dependent GTPase A [bacterium]|nr:ribosome small subunit-dependent GTPase A [candidate division CSSED10-310 bacterium]
MNLHTLGWHPFFQATFATFDRDGGFPARIAYQQKDHYLVYSECGELIAQTSGAFRHGVLTSADLPAVGDWVMMTAPPPGDRGIIHTVLPRRSAFIRKRPGNRSDEQVMAANVDYAFLVSGLDREFNPHRMERYVTLCYDSGAQPVIVLNKADLHADIDPFIAASRHIGIGLPVVAISAANGFGLNQLGAYLTTGTTVVLLGSSGVGKSTIINAILGSGRQQVQAISDAVHKGRHTTTIRELIMAPGGGVLLDTPGLREVGMWGSEERIDHSFGEIEELAASCRFRDCTHHNEPGCAIREAIATGSLDPLRLRSYLKLQRELRFQEQRRTEGMRQLERKKYKQIAKISRSSRKMELP